MICFTFYFVKSFGREKGEREGREVEAEKEKRTINKFETNIESKASETLKITTWKEKYLKERRKN